MSRMGNLMIDQLNDCPVILLPGEVWVPESGICMSVDKEEEDKCLHVWKKVLLFRTTVEECVKCKEVKEKHNGE